MKISNTRIIRNRFRILLGLLFLFFLSIFLVGLIYFQMAVYISGIFLLVFLLILRFFIVGLKYFEYEFYGEVVTIRKWRVFSKKNENLVEFPKNKLLEFEISHFWHYSTLRLLLFSKSKKTVSIHYTLSGLSRDDISKLEKTLKTILKDKTSGSLSNDFR